MMPWSARRRGAGNSGCVMLDRWLKRAGVDAESISQQGSQEARIFDASQWSLHDGAAESPGSGRPRRHSSRPRKASAQRLALFGMALIFACATALLLLPGESGAAPEEQK